MKINTSDLIGAALDWAVAYISGALSRPLDLPGSFLNGATPHWSHVLPYYKPSTDWSLGGPIIERAAIQLGTQRDEPGFRPDPKRLWHAQMDTRVYVGYGPTPLVAAMRCYVASKLGDTVDVPDELMEVPMKA